MAKTSGFASNVLQLVFNNVDIANIGDGPGLQNSAAEGNLYVSLHTADPSGGDQTTSEAAYTSYARQAVPRNTGGSGWQVTGSTVDNEALITFPEATGGSETITHFGIGTDSSGAGTLLYSGVVDSDLAVSDGVQPEFPIGDCNVTES